MTDLISRQDARESRKKRFFTGVACRRGHISERYVAKGECISCLRENMVKYLAKLPPKPPRVYVCTAFPDPTQTRKCTKCSQVYPKTEEHFSKVKYGALRSVCRNCQAKDLATLSVVYKKRAYEKARMKYAIDPSKRKFQNAQYRAQNADKIRQKVKQWRIDNPEKYAAQWNKRRSRKQEAAGTVTASDLASIREMQRNKCAVCRVGLKDNGTIDHIVPLSKGGSNFRSNIQLLCSTCNSRKHARDPIEFMQSRGMLL